MNSFVGQDICNDQLGVDDATDTLSKILIEGAMQSQDNISLIKPSLSKCSKGKSKKRHVHPKWHDISCADALKTHI